jgi:hypothetical protein
LQSTVSTSISTWARYPTRSSMVTNLRCTTLEFLGLSVLFCWFWK